MRDDFWAGWHREYLQFMNQSSKWNKEQPNIEIGSMVIIKSENSPTSRWQSGQCTSW